MFTAERFNDPKYSRPRYRLRSDVRLGWCNDGFTHGSYKLKRDAEKRAAELNVCNEQRINRIVLADYLEQHVTDAQYDQDSYFNSAKGTACALGHAAMAGIGGFYRDGNTLCNDRSWCTSSSADLAFGRGAYDWLFATWVPVISSTRTAVINRLRNFGKL